MPEKKPVPQIRTCPKCNRPIIHLANYWICTYEHCGWRSKDD